MLGLGAFVEDVEVFRIDVEAAVVAAGDLPDDPMPLECAERFGGGQVGHAQGGCGRGGRGDGMLREALVEAQRGGGFTREGLPVPCEEVEEPPRRPDGAWRRIERDWRFSFKVFLQ